MFFKSIQLLRAIAAIYITLFHLSYWWNSNNNTCPHIFDFGFAAVDLFFVISGFVLFRSASVYKQGGKEAFHFFVKRLVRIYPVYWIILGFYLCFGIYRLSSVTAIEFLKICILYPNSKFFIYSVWTMSYEIFFYILLGIYVLNHYSKWIFYLLTALSILTLAKTYSLINIPLPEIGIYNHFVFDFFMGVFVAKFFKQIPLWLALALSITGFYFFFFPIIKSATYGIVYGIPSMFILFGLTNLEFRKKINIPSWIALTGNASYILYLIHPAFIENILPHLHFTPAINRASFLLVVVLIVVLSVIIHITIEKPMLAYLNKKIQKAFS